MGSIIQIKNKKDKALRLKQKKKYFYNI